MPDDVVIVPAPEAETPGEFATEVLRDTVEVMTIPAVAIAGAAVSLVPDVTLAILRWPFHNGRITPVECTITTMALLILAKAWFALTVSSMGLAYLRRERVGFLANWVPVQTALRIAAVNIPLLAAIVLGTLAFVLPGVYLLAMWSQTPMVMLDGRGRWFDAANYSASLTDGYKTPIVMIWIGVMIVTGTASVAIESGLPAIGLGAVEPPARWALNAVNALFGAALAASLYYNLFDRAPWNQAYSAPRW